MKLITPNRAKSCIIGLVLILIGYGLFKIALNIYPKIFPTEENLEIKEWKTYTQFWQDEPLFTLKYPKDWQITKRCGGGGFPCINIYSPWNQKNSINKNFVRIQLTWADTDYSWGGTDPLLGSADLANKISVTNENFFEYEIDGLKSLFPNPGVMSGEDNNNVYIFTDKNIFGSVGSKLIFRFKLIYNTKQNSEKIEKSYYQIVKSFNYLE